MRPLDRAAAFVAIAAAILMSLACLGAPGASAAEVEPAKDPAIMLAMMKAAAGGPALDKLVSRHVVWHMSAAGLDGVAEQWDELTTGRSYGTYKLGSMSGAQGFDGKALWTQDESGASRAETSRDAAEGSVSAAFRTSMAQWFPSRRPGTVEYARDETDGDASYYVLRISPQGGRPYELWVNRKTNLVWRLVEREATAMRVETYSDYRDVSGVRMPFAVSISRGDARYDQLFALDRVEFGVPLDSARFEQPRAAAVADWSFPPGKTSVDVPFRVVNGHVYVLVKLHGKGPYLMLLGSRSGNVVQPDVARSAGLTVEGGAALEGRVGAGIARVDVVDVGGVQLRNQVFSTTDLQDFATRVEGVDGFAGLLGYELFRRFPVRLDYDRSVLTLYDPATFKYTGPGTRVGLTFRSRAPEIAASLDGVQATFDIDVGNASAIDVAAGFAAANGLVNRYGATRHVVAHAGTDGRAYALLARPSTLDLSGIAVTGPVAMLSQSSDALADDASAGTIGFGVLRQFRATFDYASQSLWLEKGAAYGRPDVADRAGLWIERTARGFEVIDVVEGSPADAAGLESGDVLKSIDGKSADTLSLAEVRARFKGAAGSRLRLILGGTKPRQADIVLRDLV